MSKQLPSSLIKAQLQQSAGRVQADAEQPVLPNRKVK